MTTCAPPSDFDVLRARQEYLLSHIHRRSVYKSLWANLVPRDEWPVGAGYDLSNFTIGRQYPDSAELNWQQILPVSPSSNPTGECNVPWVQVNAGELEQHAKPAVIGMIGPTVCQDTFTHKWESPSFWKGYMDGMERYAAVVPINRLGVVYRQYVPKLSCKKNAVWAPGRAPNVQPPPAQVDMSDFLVGGICGPPTSYLTYEYLNQAHLQVSYEGAQNGDTASWINMGNGGPIWPILIGEEASKNIELNNPELRADTNAGYMGLKEMNPTLMRLGATKIVGNFRHVPNLFPNRYIYVPYGQQVLLGSTGTNSSTPAGSSVAWQWAFLNVDNCPLSSTPGNCTVYTGANLTACANPYWYAQSAGATNWSNPNHYDMIVQIPDHVQSNKGVDVTQGIVSVVNGCWVDPSVNTLYGSGTGVIQMESCELLNPLVFTERVVIPVNSMPGMDLTPQNYNGMWKFVDGIEAFLGINGCTAPPGDPLRKMGRHFGEYRAGWEPVHPQYGRMILYIRCPSALDEVTCT